MPEESWCNTNVVEFPATIPDSGLYHIDLCLRHTTDYEMANLWCFLTTRSTVTRLLQDTVNIKVAEPDGRWLGEGGTVKTLSQGINRNPVTLPKGTVTFRLEQGMRSECLKGIKDVGIKIIKVGN